MGKQPLIMAGALLCLIGILAMPAAAFNPWANRATSDTGSIDADLKEELWAIHVNHRLARYDLNVQTAGDVIGTLNAHGYDTGNMSATLDTIGGEREALSSALQTRDRTALRDINQDLLGLWKNLRQQFRQLFHGA
jgi:hypothetical protein